MNIQDRYDIEMEQIGADLDHIHLLCSFHPKYGGGKVVRIFKSITARELFKRKPEVKHHLWGGEFWSDGYYISTVGKHKNEHAIRDYVKNQGKEKEYTLIHRDQLKLDL